MRWLILAAAVIVGSLIHLWNFIKTLRTKEHKIGKSRCGANRLGNRGGITEEEKEELLKYLEQL